MDFYSQFQLDSVPSTLIDGEEEEQQEKSEKQETKGEKAEEQEKNTENQSGVEDKENDKEGINPEENRQDKDTPSTANKEELVQEDKLIAERDAKIEEISSKKEEERTKEEVNFLKEFKEENKGEEEENPHSALMDILIKNNYIEVDDDKEYTKDEEGLEQLLADHRNQAINIYKESIEDSELKQALEFYEKGGKFDEYLNLKNQINYEEVGLEEELNQKTMIQHYLINQGITDNKKIQDKIEKYEDAGILKEEAETAQEYLAKVQKEKKERLIKEQNQKAEQEEQRRKEEADQFKEEVLNLNKIGEFEITKNEAKKLYDYITKPVKNGKTQNELDHDQETQLKIAYFKMKNFKLGDKVKKQVSNKSVKEIKEALTRLNDTKADRKEGGKQVREEVNKEVSISDIPFMHDGSVTVEN